MTADFILEVPPRKNRTDFGERVGGCGLAFSSIEYRGTQHALNLMSQQSCGDRRPTRRAGKQTLGTSFIYTAESSETFGI